MALLDLAETSTWRALVPKARAARPRDSPSERFSTAYSPDTRNLLPPITASKGRWVETRSLVMLATDLKHEAIEMNRAATAGDFDGARFRASSIAAKAAEARLAEIHTAALRVLLYLGPIDTPPTPGFGKEMLHLADLLVSIAYSAQADE